MNDLPFQTMQVINDVLALEETSSPRWDIIGDMCDQEVTRLNEGGLGASVNGIPYQFLEDYDIRRKDCKYGERQRKEIKDFLKSQTM